MVSQKKSGTSKKIQWDFQISRVGSLDFLDLKVNGSPEVRVVSKVPLEMLIFALRLMEKTKILT